MILASTIFETGVKIATKIRREKNENCVEFSFHSISGFDPVALNVHDVYIVNDHGVELKAKAPPLIGHVMFWI